MPLAQDLALRVENQEKRLDEIEDSLSEISKTHAVHSEKLEAISTKLDLNIHHITEKMDYSVQLLSDKIKENTDLTNRIANKISNIADLSYKSEQRLEKLECTETKRRDRKDSLKKGIWAITIAMIGAIVGHIVKTLLGG